MADAAIRHFYVYVIFDLMGVPRYIGKGRGGRWRQHVKRSHNSRLQALYALSGEDLPIVVIREGLTNEEAFATEIALIDGIGRLNTGAGPLLNLTDGGEGGGGHVQSPETRKKHGDALRGRTASDEARAAMRAASAKRWARAEEHQRLVAHHAAMTESERAARGAKISEATRAAMANGGAAKVAASRRGKALTEAQSAVLRKMAKINRKRTGRVECQEQTLLYLPQS